jgi:hypothetical protein
MEYQSLAAPDKPAPDKTRSRFGFLSWTKASVPQASVPQDLNPIRTADQNKLLEQKFTKVTQDNFNDKTGTYYLHQPKNNGTEIVSLGKFKETNREGKYWDGPRSYDAGLLQYVYDKATMPDLENIYMLKGELDDDDKTIMQAIPPLPPRRGGNTRRRRRSKRRNKSNKA